MSDTRKKLEGLLKLSGMKTGADLAKEIAEAPPEAPPRPVRAAAPNPVPQSQPMPANTPGGQRARLNRLRDRLAQIADTGSEEFTWSSAPESADPVPLAEAVPGVLIGEPEDGFYLVRQDYPLHHRHGAAALGDLLDTQAAHFAFSASDEALHSFDPRTACFVDTETSGLAGGTGTVAFLIGVGYFVDDVFRLDQCFLRDYDDEEPMLAYLAEIFARCKTLVSYNGKSFDLPLLRTRFIQARLPFRLEAAMHLDLVHVARRVWKRRLGDCSLGNVEREVLGLERHNDVPSYLIPQIWFNFLHTGDAAALGPVFYHHKMDILSLVSLAAHLAQCLDAPEGAGFAHREDRLSIVRMHFRQKHFEDVLRLGANFLDAEPASPLRAECLEMLAFAARAQAQADALETWLEQWAAEFPTPKSLVELAKHLEHRRRDFARAAALVRQALEAAPKNETPPDLQHRLNRLTRKSGGNPLL
jgi:uncharacterized protein YprB with RNaseH-like and TPR domain